MQIRTQLAVVVVIAAGWSAGNVANVRPVLAEAPRSERLHIADLESAVARDSDNVAAARDLSAYYLEQGMLASVTDTMNRMTPAVQQDASVSLHVARALERLGDVQAAAARVNGALNRCRVTPGELADGAGCDARTQTELAIESDALDRMIRWGITPVTDPSRAALAHELSVRPIRLAPTSL